MIPSDRRRFARALLMILLAALALRVGYVLTVTRSDHHVYDAFYYDSEATTLAAGHGFVNPFAGLGGQKAGPAADHPPLTSIALIPAAKLDQAATWLARDSLAMRFEMALLGVGVVAAIGLLGRCLAGDGVGLLAAAIAAIYPNLWMNDGLVMSETLATLLTVISLLLVYRIVRRSSAASLVALGVVCGLATLTRAELVLYVPLLAVPAVWIGQRSSRRAALAAVGVVVLAAAVVVGPWVIYNLTRFEDPVFVSTNDGIALVGSNCHTTYYGQGIGLTSLGCLGRPPAGDESAQSSVYRQRAFDYIKKHAARFPVVALARVGRLWSFWNPANTITFNEGEGRPSWASLLGVVSLFLLLLATVPGVGAARRRGVAVWPLLVPAVVVTAAAVGFYGQPRFRAPAEPAIVVVAAIGMDAGLARRRRAEPSSVAVG
jgi:4-amino-4-deoxy-L-arabinose transferase-like glycosyltransferase